jgi:hypothetical protein
MLKKYYGWSLRPDLWTKLEIALMSLKTEALRETVTSSAF